MPFDIFRLAAVCLQTEVMKMAVAEAERRMSEAERWAATYTVLTFDLFHSACAAMIGSHDASGIVQIV